MSDRQRAFEVPPQLRRGGTKHKAEEYVEEGRDLLAYMSDTLGLPDLGTSDVLDVGCGTNFTEAILKYGIVIGSYTGTDVYKPMIDHLGQSTNDPRFTFLIFSLFVDERSGTGYGLIEDITGAAPGDWQPSGQPFRDAYPGKPLQWALYSREHAFELIEGTGWKVEQLLMPNPYVQHHFVCAPL